MNCSYMRVRNCRGSPDKCYGASPVRMVERMVDTEESDGAGIDMRVKWRVKRCDIGCLPPPGIPQAPTKVVPSTSFQNSFLLS